MQGEKKSEITGELFVFPGRIFFRGHGLITDFHSHHASSVLIAGSDSEPFHVRLEEGGHAGPYCGLVLSPGLRHQLISRSEILVIQIVPEMYRFVLAGPARSLETELCRRIRGLFASQEDCHHTSRCLDEVLSLVEGQGTQFRDHPALDARVAASLDRIQEALPELLSVSELAIQAGLSEYRFMHLFKDQVGIPVRRYTLWARMQKAAFLLQDGRSLTEAAHEAGFSDSSHMSRSFKEMFGISPSSVLGERASVKARFCSDLPGIKTEDGLPGAIRSQ